LEDGVFYTEKNAAGKASSEWGGDFLAGGLGQELMSYNFYVYDSFGWFENFMLCKVIYVFMTLK